MLALERSKTEVNQDEQNADGKYQTVCSAAVRVSLRVNQRSALRW